MKVIITKFICVVGYVCVSTCLISWMFILRPRRSRSAAAYSRQTFPSTICRSVRTYVHASVSLFSALWKNGGSDPDAVWHRRSDGSRDEGLGIGPRKGYFWCEFGSRHCNQWWLYGVRVRQRCDAVLFPNYFGQTCFCRTRTLAVPVVMLFVHSVF